MADREKVMQWLKICANGCEEGCPYEYKVQCQTDLMSDALELLKEQEPVPSGKRIKAGDIVLRFYECGHCKNAIRKPWRYCPFCGKAVKWDD